MEHSRTAFVILGILAWGDNQTGYEIRKTVESSVGFFWGESYGQLYPALKRLAGEGLIEAQPAPKEDKRKRQLYSITPAGRVCLRKWLAQPFREDPPRDEFLLKLFFACEAAPGVAAKHVRAFQKQRERLLEEFRQLRELANQNNATQPGFPYWMLTLSYGKARMEAEVAWSKLALTALGALDADSKRQKGTQR